MDQAPDHPVIGVDRADAQAFCRWLTEKEAAEGRLETGWTYRLPTDVEWSLAAGIPNEKGDTPRERNSRIRGVYPWGYVWPPPPKSGNFADQSAAGKVAFERPGDRLLPGADGFAFTSPVGVFAPSATGLHDLGGNVWEWVVEDFGGGTTASNYSAYGVVRGGSWADYKKDRFHSSFRNAMPVAQRESNIGFRIVLDSSPDAKPSR
jgi:formylglycine-generating enzyme required for sulfatase activity